MAVVYEALLNHTIEPIYSYYLKGMKEGVGKEIHGGFLRPYKERFDV